MEKIKDQQPEEQATTAEEQARNKRFEDLKEAVFPTPQRDGEEINAVLAIVSTESRAVVMANGHGSKISFAIFQALMSDPKLYPLLKAAIQTYESAREYQMNKITSIAEALGLGGLKL